MIHYFDTEQKLLFSNTFTPGEHFQVKDACGRLVLKGVIQQVNQSVDIGFLAHGFYFVLIRNNRNIIYKKH